MKRDLASPATAVRVLARTYGARGLARRGWHELRRATGAFLAEPRHLVGGPATPGTVAYGSCESWGRLPRDRHAAAVDRAKRVLAGEYEAFGGAWRVFPAGAREWRTHPVTGYAFPDEAWWRVPHLPREADIKDVWEPARFAWVYDLVRGHLLTGDPRFSEAFHARLADWAAANRPFRGVHWSCGQEVAIRAIALLHGEHLLPAPQQDGGEAARRLHQLLSWSGERIADAIGYSLSQRNNHGISEASGLIHLGLRLRGAHPQASQWLRVGRRLVEEQVRDQFAADGWYAQHSFTYMRLALEQLLLVQRMLLASGGTLSPDALARIDRAIDLLTTIIDADTGVVPNYGANDGTRLVVHSTARYRDFRPLLTLAAIVRDRPLPGDITPDPEVLCWFGGGAPRVGPSRGDAVVSGPSGWAAARVGESSVFLRAGRYMHRPSHLDPLHIDVRIAGREIVTDPGTFAYNAPAPWKNGLVTALVHNGPVVDGREPAIRGPRFLWYSWPDARIRAARLEEGTALLEAELAGHVHRSVRVDGNRVRVEDRVLDPRARSIQVTWLIHPAMREEPLVEACGAEVIEASPGAIDGWFSPTYGILLPSRALRVRRNLPADRPTVYTTIRGPAGAAPGV